MNQKETTPLWMDMKQLWRKIPGWVKLAFLSACLMGAVTHAYAGTNFLLNPDSAINIFSDNDVITTGRWALKFFSAPSTTFQLPVVGMVISILALACTAVLTVDILKIRGHLSILAVSALMVTFPVVSCIFSYMYTADAYFLALLMNALAVWIIKRWRWGLIPGVLLMATACGIYQAFLCYAVGLMLIDCILGILDNEELDQVIRQGICYVVTILLSVALYYGILQLVLNFRGVELSGYKGVDQMTSTSPLTYLKAVPRAFCLFCSYFWNTPYLTGIWLLAQRSLIVLTFLSLIVIWVLDKRKHMACRAMLLALGFILLPVALNFITVLAPNADAHELERYAFILLPILGVKLAETASLHLLQNKTAWGSGTMWCCMLLCACLVWTNFCTSNVTYLRTQLCYENTYALANRLTARMELLEGFDPEMPVVFMGIPSQEQYAPASKKFAQYNSLTGTNHSLLTYEYILRGFLPDCLGFSVVHASEEAIADLEQASWVEQMPCYPAEGCMEIRDGILVVKLGPGGALRWSL